MIFTDKYTSESIKLEESEKDKAILSDDAYAIGEVIQALINQIEKTRVSLK